MSQLTDTLATVSHAKHVLKKIDQWMKPEKRKARFPLNLLGSSAYVQHQPYGVIGIIAPWNFPISLSISYLYFVGIWEVIATNSLFSNGVNRFISK